MMIILSLILSELKLIPACVAEWAMRVIGDKRSALLGPMLLSKSLGYGRALGECFAFTVTP